MLDSMNPSLQAWALNELHPSWLPDIDADLVRSACCSVLGRRWLAVKLASDHALFRAPVPKLAGEEPLHSSNPWLFASVSDQVDLLLELGALSCASELRSIISRTGVLQLRRMLGASLYARVLQQSGSDVVSLPGLSDFEPRRWPQEDAEFTEVLVREGATELYLYSRTLHEAAAERVLLAFPQGTVGPRTVPKLRISDIHDCLRLVVELEDIRSGASL